MISSFILFLLILLASTLVGAGFIEPMTSTPLRPYSVNQDYTTDYVFAMQIPSSIPFNGFLEVEFPLPYSLPSNCKSYIQALTLPFAQYSCSKIGSSKYLVNVGTITPGDYQVVFESIRNPSAYPASSNFKIRTYFGQNVLVDANEYFDAVPFLPTPVLSNGANVTNLGYQSVSLGSKFDFAFTLNKQIKQGDSIKFNFPEGFFFVKPACFHKNSGSYAQPETLHNNRMVICQAFLHDIPANTPQVVTVLGVVNPDHAGFFQGFSLETMEGTSPNIIEKVIVPKPVRIDPGSITIRVTSESLLRAANTTYELDLVFENEIPAGREIWIKIPPGFRYLADNCTLLRSLQPEKNGEVTCGLVSNKTGYLIRGFAGISASQLVSVQISAENPPLSANYTIQVFSFSPIYQAKIDEAFTNISIQGQFGSSRFFKSHSLRYTRRLKYNETGPMEFTFFLNEPLPATASTFEGKIVIDIRPHIPDPGNVTCFFYETVRASLCTWEVDEQQNVTTVTIFTPVTSPYYQTEIPITITTEEDTGTAGIQLPELIQRYNFYIYFYKNKEQHFHEVYYEDYVPDPITMPDTWIDYVFAPMQYGEESYLKIVWRNEYLDLGTNYFVELEFDHSNQAWDYSLGWPTGQWYEKYLMPCIVENLGTDYKCYLKPGGAADTVSTIQVVGLSAIPKVTGSDANTPIFHFPKIKFGTQGRASMTFTLYQNTPGENTVSIPIMFKDIEVSPQSQRNVSTLNLTVELTPTAKVNETANLGLSLTPSVAPSYVIYTYPSLFWLETGISEFARNKKCYVFADPVNWIVFDSSAENGEISITPSVISPPYVGTLDFTARTIQQGMIVTDKRQGNITIIAGNPAVTLKLDSNSTEVNRYSNQLFDITFTTMTPLPPDSYILLDLTGFSVQNVDDLFCTVTGLVPLDTRGVICERISTKTKLTDKVRIYNIDAVPKGTAIAVVLECYISITNLVNATVNTYYYRNGTKLVDSGTHGLIFARKNYNFTTADLINDRSNQIVRAGNTGKFQFVLTPTNASRSAVVTFSKEFSTTSTRDVPLCRVKGKRQSCSIGTQTSQTPLVLTVDTFTASGGTPTSLSVTTDYAVPRQKGIKAPTTPGWYPVFVTLKGASSYQEKVGDFVYIYPNAVPGFNVEAVPISANQFAMYTFKFNLSKAVNSNSDTNTRGRIFINFPVGSDDLFATDLGTGMATGEYIGCNVQGLTAKPAIHCRIILAPAANLTTSVEIIGFDKVSATAKITVRIAKIMNPKTTLGELVFALRTEHVDVTSSQVTPLEYTTFNLWQLVQNGTTPQTVNSPTTANFQAQSVPGQTGRTLSITLYSTLGLSAGDYYVFELPPELVPSLTLTPPAGVDLALSFPDAGWVVYRLNRNVAASSTGSVVIQTITIPSNFPPSGYTIKGYVWKNDLLRQFVIHTTETVSGDISNVNVITKPTTLTRGSLDNEVLVEFTTLTEIPDTGSIEVRFPTGFIPHANCMNMDLLGSQLESNEGRVACATQGTSWFITNFKAVAASTVVKIYGTVDLANQTQSARSLGIYTYANQDADIVNNGRVIDALTNAYTFTISASTLNQSQNTTETAVSPPTFRQFSITQLNRIALSNSQLDLTFALPQSLSQDSATTETFLILEFQAPPYDADLGSSTTTFEADNITFFNGMPIPSVLPTALGSQALATLHWGNTRDPACVILSLPQGLSSGTETIRLAYIKNPDVDNGLSVKASIVRYSKTGNFVQVEVLYQTDYTNYGNTIASGAANSASNKLVLSFSSLVPNKATTMTLSGKNYGVQAGDNYKIYVKLENEAQGFDYSSITSISCNGYTVQWFKTGYIFFLVPNPGKGSTPTIVCSGFKLGSQIKDLIVETGIYKAGSSRTLSSRATQTMVASRGNQGDSVTVTRVVDANNIPNKGSINLYLISYNPSSFNLEAGGSILIEIPSNLEVVSDRLKHVVITGLNDRTTGDTLGAVNAVLEGSNIRISGYDTYNSSNGNIAIQVFMKNLAAGSTTLSLKFFDAQGNQVSQSTTDNSQSFEIATSPNPVNIAIVGPYLTDDVDVYMGEKYQLLFNLQFRYSLASANGNFQVTLPDGFKLDTAEQFVCKYSSDNGTHWIRSTDCSNTSNILTVPLVTGFDIAANANVLLLITSNSSNTSTSGIIRPSTPVIHTFNVKAIPASGSVQSSFLPLIIYPSPDKAATLKWYTRGSKENSIIQVSFTTDQEIQATDFFQLELVTDDELSTVFPYTANDNDVQNRWLGNCADDPTIASISQNSSLDCFVAKGRATSPASNARVIIRAQNTIASGSAINFFVANITNPNSGKNGGYVMNVMRPCREDGLGCPILRKRDYVAITSASRPRPRTMSIPTLEQSKLDLFLDQVTTSYQLLLSAVVTSTDAVIFKTSVLNVQLVTECKTTQGMCIHFPKLGWTFFQSKQAMGSPSKISISMDNAIFYDRSKKLTFTAETWVQGKIVEIFTSAHPQYKLMVPVLGTTPTQAEIGVPRIVRNFDNILELSMEGIWRTDLIQRIIVNTPDSYPPIADYCMAGVNLANISSPEYIEFACQKQSDRQILIVIDEPWQEGYQNLTVVLYYRGFLDNNASHIGQTSPSTITSFASLTNDWVVDENTNYNFTVDPEPTPIIRNISLNLKSFYDRQARILDYVEFYGAIWPNTPYDPQDPQTQITQMLFQVNNEYAYPSVSNLICETKVIFGEFVNCVLRRTQGRTEILADMPVTYPQTEYQQDYQHGPFLFRITNTQENLLFKAPDHEGSFLFNLTFLNALGQPVEKGVSYMDISGQTVAFTAVPILADPLNITLYDIGFTTGGRVTPPGFVEAGQNVRTEIVLLFQTYAPGFPIDLGSGLANGSEISCIPVKGITVLNMKKLTCTLVYGTSILPTQIIITGYDSIPASTDVRIFLDQIRTLKLNQTSRIQLEIHSIYTGSDEQFLFYDSESVSTLTPTAYNPNAPASMTIVPPTSTTLKGTSSYTFTFDTTTALRANRDYIIIEFPAYGYELDGDYTGVSITITTPSIRSASYIMPKRNVIYIQPTQNLAAGQTTVSVQYLPAPSFSLNGVLGFTVRTVVNSKVTDIFNDSFEYNSKLCQLFANEKITTSSKFIRVNENTYQISFTLLHTVPPTGSLAIIFNSDMYNLRPSNPQCQLIAGFSPLATCTFELFSQQLVRINLNGIGLSIGSEVKLNIINVNNPINPDMVPEITIQSYFDAEFGTTKTICSKAIELPKFLSAPLTKCPVNIQPEINNANKITDYLLTIFCSTIIRNYTVIEVQFPTEFQGSLSSGLSCSTNGNYLLQPCSLTPRTLALQILTSKPDSQTSIVARIRGVKNPVLPGTYGPFDVRFSQYGTLYAGLDPVKSLSQVTIIKDTGTTANKNLVLSVFPKNFGEKATYYFKLVSINFAASPDTVLIKFDKVFAQNLGSSLECGTFTPQEQFSGDYAVNYEEMADKKMFVCSLNDDNVLMVNLTPVVLLPAKQQDFFFFVRNILNPNINSASSNTNTRRSYSFAFTFLANQTAVAYSQNSVQIDFGLPPSLIQITKITSSDTNILAPSNYTMTVLARSNLPSSNELKDYELAVSLPVEYYPDFASNDEFNYSFPNNPKIQQGSSAYNYNGVILFDALFPDLSTISPFNLQINNINNPEIESSCGITSTSNLPIKFGVQYLSRRENSIYGKTYAIMDQNNCLTVGKYRVPIKVISPLFFRQGLVYTIILQIEQPGSGLTITPFSNSLIFEPTKVTFSDYQTKIMSLQVYVPRNVPQGDYKIKWIKKEASTPARYLEIEDTQVVVIPENAPGTMTPLPKVRIEAVRYVWAGKYPRDVLVTLDQAPAEELTVEISSRFKDKNLQGSPDGSVYAQFPIMLRFSRGESQKKFYLFAERGAVDNVLIYKLGSTNAKAYDSSVLESPFMIKTEQSRSSFQILSIKQSKIAENNATYFISLSDIGTVFYLAMIKSSLQPTTTQIINGQIPQIDQGLYQAGSINVQKIQNGTSISALFDISNLHSQVDYQIYFVGRDNFGDYTGISSDIFTTHKMSEGASIVIPTTQNVSSTTLISALSTVLTIPKSRISIQDVASEIESATSDVQLTRYKIIIIPDPYNNQPVPLAIANKLAAPEKQTEFQALVPQYAFNLGVRITPVKGNYAQIMVDPSVLEYGYYHVLIKVDLISSGTVYGIAIEKGKDGDSVPTSFQISQGLLSSNVRVGNDFFNKTVTDGVGSAVLYFDELKDFTEYDVYITAGNNVPYEPTDLLKDQDVKKVNVTTLKNPNLGDMDTALQLYNQYYIKNYGSRVGSFSMLIIIFLLLIIQYV